MSQLALASLQLTSALAGPPDLFAVSYDLRVSGQDYPGLIAELNRLNGLRIQQSLWWVPSYQSAFVLRDDLIRYMDGNDSLMVAKLGDIAGYEGRADVRLWIEAYLKLRAAA